MGCATCSNGGGKIPAGCGNKGHCSAGGCGKMDVFDWLADIDLPEQNNAFDIVEVRFKNGRKNFYRNVNKLHLYTGDAVSVEASPGYDVGIVTLTGELVKIQMQKKSIGFDSPEIKKVYRKAKQEEIEKWKQARELEDKTMHRARTLALNLGLEMKISDVEYQGDKTKATFYYTAEGRVDFRELIKVMAEEFKVKIEMRQIGARQEAGRLGGIGSCGRELCCSTWLHDFRTVSTGAARYQQLSINPQKLAGQCGKLKCCLNYELDMYVEAFKDFPDSDIKLQTQKGIAIHQKTDVFKKTMWYSIQGEMVSDFIPLTIDKVKQIIELNKKGIIPDSLELYAAQAHTKTTKEPDFENVVGQDSVTRFDKNKKQKKVPNNKKNFKNRNNKNKNNRNRK